MNHTCKPETSLQRAFRETALRLEVTASELAEILGVRLSTARQKLRLLERRGLVKLHDHRRKAVLNPRFGHVVGIDLGASNVRFALADFHGKLLDRTGGQIRPEDGPQKLIAEIKHGVRAISEPADGAGREYPRDLGRLSGIAIGVPSAVDPVRGLVSWANNLPGWTNIDLAGELRREFAAPVAIENDANMAAIGEHWRGVARGVENFVFVALGTGIGSGIFTGGRLHRGRTGAAGELFKLNIEWPRWKENFGDTGYLESYVSGLGIAAAGRNLRGGATSRPDEGEPASATGLAEERDARFVFEAARQGNPEALAILKRTFAMMGVAAADLVAVLDPDLIVFGGGVLKGAPDLLLATVREVVSTIHPDAPRIEPSALEDKAQTYGGIFSALTLGHDTAARSLDER